MEGRQYQGNVGSDDPEPPANQGKRGRKNVRLRGPCLERRDILGELLVDAHEVAGQQVKVALFLGQPMKRFRDGTQPVQRGVGELGNGLPERAGHALRMSALPWCQLPAHAGQKAPQNVGLPHEFGGKLANGVHLATVQPLVVLLFVAEVVPRHLGHEGPHARVQAPRRKPVRQGTHPPDGFRTRFRGPVPQEVAERLQGFRPGIPCRTDPVNDRIHQVQEPARSETSEIPSKPSTGSIRRVIVSGCKLDQQIHATLDVGKRLIPRWLPRAKCRPRPMRLCTHRTGEVIGRRPVEQGLDDDLSL